MSEKKLPCSICYRQTVDKDTAPILAMGHFGTPRYICSECETLIDTVERSHDPSEIEAAMARLGETVGNNSVEDTVVLEAVEDIFKTSTERAEKIKAGTYDFALDEKEEEGTFDEIPEELLETEEDKQKTEKEEQFNKKFNKIMDIATIVILAAAAVLFVFFMIKR